MIRVIKRAMKRIGVVETEDVLRSGNSVGTESWGPVLTGLSGDRYCGIEIVGAKICSSKYPDA